MTGLTIYRNKGGGEYQHEALLAPDNGIDHPATRGDSWTFTQLADLDGDGRIDVLGGAANGDVVWWRNLGEGKFASAVPIKMPVVPYGAQIAVVDWNQDGDADLVVGTDYGYFCWFERSFLERGYARAKRVGP